MTEAAFDALLQRLDVPITDREVYRRALTHPSWALENGGEHNERLEFLGDAVLAWIVAPRLYEAFPDAPEGDLTLMKIALTSGRTLAAVANWGWQRSARASVRVTARRPRPKQEVSP